MESDHLFSLLIIGRDAWKAIYIPCVALRKCRKGVIQWPTNCHCATATNAIVDVIRNKFRVREVSMRIGAIIIRSHHLRALVCP